MDGDIFSYHIAIAHLQARGLTGILEILRVGTQHGTLPYAIVPAQPGARGDAYVASRAFGGLPSVVIGYVVELRSALQWFSAEAQRPETGPSDEPKTSLAASAYEALEPAE